MTPWHLRISHFEHHHRFANCVDLHTLSLKWANHFKIEIHSKTPELKALQIIHQELWMLDLFPHPKLDSFLTELQPDKALSQLERLVWITQAWLIQYLFQTHLQDQNSLRSVLEQESWRAGKECAIQRWSALLSSQKKLSLSEVALAFYNSPLSNYSHTDPFLVQRSTATHAWLTRQNCPHHSPHPEVIKVSDELCSLHTHWMRGFAFSLQPSIQIEVSDPQQSCIQRWHINEAHESHE